MRFGLIATDLDGTLLNDDLHVTDRTRAALDAAREAGIAVVPVTARQPLSVRLIAQEAGFTDWAVCGNGAHALNLSTGSRLFERSVPVDTQSAVAHALRAHIPDVVFASVRDGGEVFVAQEGYASIAAHADHKRDPATMGAFSLDEVLAQPSLKLVVRHPHTANDELVELLRGLDIEGFEVTHSGAPFVEVMAHGISKAFGLAQVCREVGVSQDRVLAFGDAQNDVEMLAWAGHGVAVANAAAPTLAAADEVIEANTDDGVARYLENLLEDR